MPLFQIITDESDELENRHAPVSVYVPAIHMTGSE